MHLAVDFHLIVGDEGEIDHAQTAHNAKNKNSKLFIWKIVINMINYS
jgi:hypothetical protein